MPFQSVAIDRIYDISDWYFDDERPAGSRPKVTVKRPIDEAQFIFKEPKNECRSDQIWSEITASLIAGDMLKWPVQHVSIGRRDGRYGNLLRYIYSPLERMIEGWQLCREVDHDYDEKAGHRHTISLLQKVVNEVASPTWGVTKCNYHTYWSRAFAFDCLISNSDRHAENWAFIKSSVTCEMAPLYDNGTSLGSGCIDFARTA